MFYVSGGIIYMFIIQMMCLCIVHSLRVFSMTADIDNCCVTVYFLGVYIKTKKTVESFVVVVHFHIYLE